MFGNHFYNETTRKYVSAFGTLFNDIQISRKDNSGNTVQTMTVPIHYGPYQKFLAKLDQDPALDAPAITLPRMSFEITNISYDPSRKLSSISRNSSAKVGDADSYVTQFSAVPYNIDVQLNIMTKYMEDGTKIIEQILPFFTPDFTPKMDLLNDLSMAVDVPIILTDTSQEDTYDSDFETRRSLIWTLNFTMKAYFFGPETDKKVIKFSEANVHTSSEGQNDPFEKITVQPGLTANGEPTTSSNNSISYNQIEVTDNWDYIVTIEDL